MRDLLVSETPTVLRADLYAIAALVGALAIVFGSWLRLPQATVAVVGAALCFGIRFEAIRKGWKLPTSKNVTTSVQTDGTPP